MTLRMKVQVKLDTRRLTQVRRALTKAASKHVEVGFFGGKPHPADPNLTVASIAAIQEFGAPDANIPERPFMSTTARYTTVGKVMVGGVEAVIRWGGGAANYSLWARSGLHMAKEMSQVIATWSVPANAPRTIAKKGFNDPLVETGYMRDHVEYRVKS